MSCKSQYRTQQDRTPKKVIAFVSIAIEIGAIEISSYGGELGDQDALRHGWPKSVTQLPLFCNCRFTGIRADGAQLGSCPTRGCVRLLFAFYTGSSDLGFNTNSILRRHITIFCCVFLVTAELQDKRAPFEPRGGPGMGKDKHQAGQMGLNPPPLWYRAPRFM